MAMLYLVIIVSLLYSLANGQFQLQPEETSVEGVLGGALTLTWNMLNYPDGKRVVSAIVYMDGDEVNKALFGHLASGPAKESYATKTFGDRISATISIPQYYKLTISNLNYNDTGVFTLRMIVDFNKFLKDEENITITKIRDPKKPGGGDPKKPGGGDPKKPGVGDPEEGSNTGAIVGGVIGGIVFVALIVVGVLYFLRWKKNRGSSEETTKKLNSGNQTYEAPQYADTSVALGNDRQAPAKEY